MNFTLISSILVACMTAFVSASPVPVALSLESRESLPREPAAEVAREAEAEPEPICLKYQCE